MGLLCAQTKWFKTYILFRNRKWCWKLIIDTFFPPKIDTYKKFKLSHLHMSKWRDSQQMHRASVTHSRYVQTHEEAVSTRDALRACCCGKRQSSTCSTARVTARCVNTHRGQFWRKKSSRRTPASSRCNSCSCLFLQTCLILSQLAWSLQLK